MSSLLKRYIKQMLRAESFPWLGMHTLLYSHFLFLFFFFASCCFYTNLPGMFHLSLHYSVFLLLFSSFTSFFSFQLSHDLTFDEQFDHFATKVCLAVVEFTPH